MRQPEIVSSRSGLVSSSVTTVMGAILVIGSLISYEFIADSSKVIESTQIDFLEQMAYLTLGAILVGITMALLGVTSLLRKRSYRGNPTGHFTSLSNIAMALSSSRSMKVFLGASVTYGLLFAVVSSSLVFQLGSNFSGLYGVQVPSVVPVLCCGTFGQMPQLVVYATQQLAFLVVPLNLILLFTVSWLVGLNAASVSYLYSYRSRAVGPKWFGGFGAIVGLFTACPACAGFFFLSTLGLSGASAAALTLASLQGIFVLVGVPILVGSLLLSARQISLNCAITSISAAHEAVTSG